MQNTSTSSDMPFTSSCIYFMNTLTTIYLGITKCSSDLMTSLINIKLIDPGSSGTSSLGSISPKENDQYKLPLL